MVVVAGGGREGEEEEEGEEREEGSHGEDEEGWGCEDDGFRGGGHGGIYKWEVLSDCWLVNAFFFFSPFLVLPNLDVCFR